LLYRPLETESMKMLALCALLQAGLACAENRVQVFAFPEPVR
jgi:hypothetical protein